MRTKSTFIFISLMLMLSPALAVFGTPVNTSDVVPHAVGDFLVAEGTTIYYDLTQFVLPDSEGFIPDLSGNTLYVKVLYVQDKEFAPEDTRKVIWYAIGLIFENDETFTIGEGTEAFSVIVPAGAATPSIILQREPIFNSTMGPPAFFFINNDWASHEAVLTTMNMTITSTTTHLKAEGTMGDGETSGSWRKSDGILEHLLFDNVDLGFMNLTGGAVEVTFNRLEVNTVPIAVNTELEFIVDTAKLSITTTGYMASLMNDSVISSMSSQIQQYEGKSFTKIIVKEIKGTFYACDTYNYDPLTDTLKKDEGRAVFNGFFGSFLDGYDPFTEETLLGPKEAINYQYQAFPIPFITADWDIYAGQMKLYDTILNVFLDRFDELVSPPTSEVAGIVIDGEMELAKKRDFYYFRAAIGVSAELNASALMPMEEYLAPLEHSFEVGFAFSVELEGYLAYHKTGVGAALRAKIDIFIELFDDQSTPVFESGTMKVTLDVKLSNPNYNVPDILKGGFIPGFTWFIIIPTLLGAAAVGLVHRRRM